MLCYEWIRLRCVVRCMAQQLDTVGPTTWTKWLWTRARINIRTHTHTHISTTQCLQRLLFVCGIDSHRMCVCVVITWHEANSSSPWNRRWQKIQNKYDPKDRRQRKTILINSIHLRHERLINQQSHTDCQYHMMGGSDSRQSTTIYYREVDFSVAAHLNLAHISESDAKTQISWRWRRKQMKKITFAVRNRVCVCAIRCHA